MSRRWPAAAAVASLAFGSFILAWYFWLPLRAGLWACAGLTLLALAALGAGRAVLAVPGLPVLHGGERPLAALTLGLGALSLGSAALAAAGMFGAAGVALLLGSGWVLGLEELRRAAPALRAALDAVSARPLAAAAVGLPVGLALWTCFIPPHHYDSLVYHLPLAAETVRTGGLSGIEGLVYAYFPQNGEMLFALALLLRSDLLAQALMWLAMALSLLWLLEAGRREVPRRVAELACLLLATHTSVLLLAGTAYVECLAMLWTTAALFSFLRAGEEDGAGRPGWVALSALFTGLALGTKYYAGITAALLGGALAYRALRLRSRAAVAEAALFVGITTALFVPWMLRNWLSVGNPVFPFFTSLFPAADHGWNAEVARGYLGVLGEYRHAGSYWGDLFSLPLLLLTNDPRFGRGADVLGGLGWELLFWFLPLAVWAARGRRILKALLLFCAGYLAAWLATGVVLRFLTPLAPALCLASAWGLHALWPRLARPSRLALGGGVVLLTACHLLLFAFIEFGVFQGAAVLLGLESRGEYLSRRLDYYPCAAASGQALADSDRVLLVGEQRGYYLEQGYLPTTVHAPNRFIEWAEASANPAELTRRIREGGFSAVLVVPREAARLGEGMGRLTERGFRNWAGMEPGFVEPLFKGPACTLYRLNKEKRA